MIETQIRTPTLALNVHLILLALNASRHGFSCAIKSSGITIVREMNFVSLKMIIISYILATSINALLNVKSYAIPNDAVETLQFSELYIQIKFRVAELFRNAFPS